MKPEDIILQKVAEFKPTDILIIRFTGDAEDIELEAIGKALDKRNLNYLMLPDDYSVKVWRGDKKVSEAIERMESIMNQVDNDMFTYIPAHLDPSWKPEYDISEYIRIIPGKDGTVIPVTMDYEGPTIDMDIESFDLESRTVTIKIPKPILEHPIKERGK